MDPSAALSTNEAPTEASQPERVPFRFGSVVKRHPAPSDVIYLDEAIDRYGTLQFPNDWGRSEIWREMPFKRNKKSKKYVRYKIVGSAFFGFERESINISTQIYRKSDLKQANDIYKKVRAAFVSALQAGDLIAAEIHKSGKVTKIEGRRALWSEQAHEIFFTGRTIIGSRTRRLVLNKAPFERWLRGKRSRYVPGPLWSLLNTAANEIIGRLTVVKIKRADFKALIESVLSEYNFATNDKTFKEQCWKGIRQKRAGQGRPPQVADQVKEEAMAALRMGLQKALNEWEINH